MGSKKIKEGMVREGRVIKETKGMGNKKTKEGVMRKGRKG